MATNTITDKNTLKSWFKRGLKPLEAHFHAWMDAYWHKSEKIPTSSIEGLEKTLNSKAESFAVESAVKELQTHRQDTAAHKTENEQAKLNNLADDPNITYATKEELEASGAIIIPVDFSKNDETLKSDILAFLHPYIESGEFFEKPIWANYIWKSPDYLDDSNEYEKSIMVIGEAFEAGMLIGYEFNSPVAVNQLKEGENHEFACSIRIAKRVYDGKWGVTISKYKDKFVNPVFLYNNGDGFITTQDRDRDGMPVSVSAWTDFFNALKEKKTPALYLRTPNTDVYLPASYHFKENETNFDGTIKILYVEGKQLCTEEIRFEKNQNGGFGGSGSVMIDDPKITRIPIGKELNYLNIDCSLMTEEEGFETPAFKDSLTEQISQFEENLPVLVKFLYNTDKHYYVIADMCKYYHFENEDGTESIAHSIKILMDNREVEAILKTNSLEINMIVTKSQETQTILLFQIIKYAYKFSKTIFLHDNGDHFIGIQDKMANNNWKNMSSFWDDLQDELVKGCLPAVYLNSVDSGAFYPASYKFVPKPDAPGMFDGYIEISYLEEIDGKRYLCREKRIFDGYLGNGSTYSGTGGNRRFTVEKIPLDPNVSLVTEYPDDLSSYPDGSIFIKQEIV